MFHYLKYKQWPTVWTYNLIKRVNWFQSLIGRVKSPRWFPLVQIHGSRSRYSRYTHNFLSTGNVTTQAQQCFGFLRGNRSIFLSYREIPISLDSPVQSQDSLFTAVYRAWVPRTKSSFPSVWFTLVHSNSWFLEPIIICLGVWGNPGISGNGIPEIFINTFS